MQNLHSLSELKQGQHAKVMSLLCDGGIRRRLLDIGLVENTEVECVAVSPCGDPSAYLIRGAVIAIRSEDSDNIIINPS